MNIREVLSKYIPYPQMAQQIVDRKPAELADKARVREECRDFGGPATRVGEEFWAMACCFFDLFTQE